MDLSVAWFATPTLVAITWLYEGFIFTRLERGKATSTYIGLTLCALLECGLLNVWRDSLFVVSQSKFQIGVQGLAIDAEWTLEESARETVRTLVGGKRVGNEANQKRQYASFGL